MSVPKLVKPSISRLVREVINNDLSLQDALSRGYGNLSAIARLIKPKVEESLGRRVNLETVVTSLKRIRREYVGSSTAIQSVVAASVVNVRTDVTKLSVEKTKRALDTVRRMLADYQQEFLQVSESISAITLIFSQTVKEEIRSMFRKEEILEDERNLAAIIVQSPYEIVKTPGCIITFYNQLSRRHINIEDTVSCYTDTIMLVRLEDVAKAFEALTELISSSRKALAKKKRSEFR